MLEVLKIIVLACQLGTGNSQDTVRVVDSYQWECRQQLIKCVYKYDHNPPTDRLKHCLVVGR